MLLAVDIAQQLWAQHRVRTGQSAQPDSNGRHPQGAEATQAQEEPSHRVGPSIDAGPNLFEVNIFLVFQRFVVGLNAFIFIPITPRPVKNEVIQRGVFFPSEHGPQSIDWSDLFLVRCMEARDLLASSPMLEDRYSVPDIVAIDVAIVSELNELGLVESEVHYPELLGLPQLLYQAVYILREDGFVSAIDVVAQNLGVKNLGVNV